MISAACTIAPGLGALSFVFIIPLMYGVLYYFLVPDNVILGPGLTMMNFVLFVRYIILPPIFKYYGFLLNSHNTKDYVSLAIYISIVEIITILTAIKFSSKKENSPKQISKISMNKKVPFILFFTAVAVYVFNPDVLANMHFIFNPEMIIAERIDFSTNVWVKLIEWAQLFVVLFSISLFYDKYRSIFLVSAVAIIPCFFYSGRSRLSLLLPLVSTLFLLIKLFPLKKKLFFITFSLFAFIAMGSLTIVKNFRVEMISEINDFEPSQLLNAYFGGIPNIATGLYVNDIFANKIGADTIINDMFRNGMVISSFFQSQNNSVHYFNQAFDGLGDVEIIPTTCQGVFYFGYLFFWIPTLLMVKIVLYSDKIYFTSSKIEYVWIFSIFSAAIGWAIPGSLQHLFMNFHALLFPLLILAIFNRIRIAALLKKVIIPMYIKFEEKFNKKVHFATYETFTKK